MPRGSSYLPWGFLFCIMTNNVIPLQHIDGKAAPTPRALIMMILSDFRKSDKSDAELSELIASCLYEISITYDADISAVDDPELLYFKKRQEKNNDGFNHDWLNTEEAKANYDEMERRLHNP